MPKKNLKELLADNGITQEGFAKKADLSIFTIRKIIDERYGTDKTKKKVRTAINLLILENKIPGHIGGFNIDDLFDD